MIELKTLKDILPSCICPDGFVDEKCPNELLDGAWSDSLAKDFKAEAVKHYKFHLNLQQYTDPYTAMDFIETFFNLTKEDLK